VTAHGLGERSRAAKVVELVRRHGLATTAGVIASVVEDLHVRTFDRRYGVATSGYVPLAQTSLGPDAERRGHRYRAVNAWAFRHVLKAVAPQAPWRFVDLGCGFGRACLIAARHGFTRVRGVDMVPEFCAQARRNLAAFAAHAPRCGDVEIVQADAIDYSRSADDDVAFLYNPFPAHVLACVVDNLIEGGAQPGFVGGVRGQGQRIEARQRVEGSIGGCLRAGDHPDGETFARRAEGD
jgi:SAM-dependent methyltransferase